MKDGGGDIINGIKEIVLKTGLSQSTVMRVLKGGTSVKPETREKVLAAAESIGYTINRARYTIGVVLTSEGNVFYNNLIKGIKSTADKISVFNYNVILKTMEGYNVSRQIELMEELSSLADVIIVNPINHQDVIDKVNELMQRGKIVITLNIDIENSSRICHIGVDYYKVGRIASNLISLIAPPQCKEIAVIYGTNQILSHQQRLQGFKDGIKKYAPQMKIQSVVENYDDDQKGYEVTLKLLKDNNNIDALYISAGGVSGVCRAIKDSGKAGNIIVVATGNNNVIGDFIKEGIISATVCQNPFEQGRQAINTAFEILNSGKNPDFEKFYVKTKIILEENCN